jgi:hypothetical protein
VEINSLNPPNDERLRWFETSHRVTLPEDFAAFLRTANGAVPLGFVFDQEGRERLIERFLPLLDGPKDDPVRGRYDITVDLSQVDSRLPGLGALARSRWVMRNALLARLPVSAQALARKDPRLLAEKDPPAIDGRRPRLALRQALLWSDAPVVGRNCADCPWARRLALAQAPPPHSAAGLRPAG